MLFPASKQWLKARVFVLAGLTLGAAACGSGIVAGAAGEFEVQATARTVSERGDLIGGPAAQARPGDIVMENQHARFIIQAADAGPFGGAVIDADIRRLALAQGYDHLGALVPWLNLGRTARATRIVISEDGRATGRAVVDVFASDAQLLGVDPLALAARLNPSDPEAALGDLAPAEDLPLEIRTRYILEPDSASLLIESRYVPQGAETPLAYGDWLEVRGVHARFLSASAGMLGGDPAPGFAPFADGEPGFNASEFVAYVADEVAYLYEPVDAGDTPGAGSSACFAAGAGIGCVAGVHWDAASGPRNVATLPAAAQADAPLLHRRRLYVGSDLAAAAAERIAVRGWTAARLPVAVAAGSLPLAGAEATLLLRDGDVWRAWQHARSNDDGLASLLAPTGVELRLVVGAPGHANATDDGSPIQIAVNVPAGRKELEPVSVTLPENATLEVFVRDHRREPLPARIAVLGRDPSPARLASGRGTIRVVAGADDVAVQPFIGSGDRPLPRAPGAVASGLVDQAGMPVTAADTVAVAAADVEGRAVFALEPGTYTVVASRGPAYAATAYTVTLAAGDTQRLLLDLPKVIDDLGWAHADLSVAAEDDPLGRQTRSDRVAAAAAAGLHLVVAGDANFIANDEAALAALGLDSILDVASSALVDVPTLGRIAAFPVAVSTIPQRTKPIAAEGEALAAATLDGGAVSLAGNRGIAAPGVLLERLANRATAAAPRILIAPDHDGTGYFARIGLTLDTSAGYDVEAPGTGGITAAITPAELGVDGDELYSDAWDALSIADGRFGLAALWHNFNTAMRLWNLGRAAPLLAASGAVGGWEPEVGTPRLLARLGSAAVSPVDTNIAARVAEAVRLGRDVVLTNGPVIDFTVQAALIDNAAGVVLDRYDSERGGASVEDIIFVRRGLYPGTDSNVEDFELRVTATIQIQAPLWAPPTRVELFSNAPATNHVPDDDDAGTFLAAITTAAWSFSATDLAMALEPATVRDELAGTVTTSTTGNRYAWTLSHTLVLSDAELLAPGLPDRWLTVRVVGDTSLYPVATGPAAARPFALANPVFIDFNNDSGASTFNVAYDGPCEVPEAERPTAIAACVD